MSDCKFIRTIFFCVRFDELQGMFNHYTLLFGQWNFQSQGSERVTSYSSSDKLLADEMIQLFCPWHLAYRVGPSASAFVAYTWRFYNIIINIISIKAYRAASNAGICTWDGLRVHYNLAHHSPLTSENHLATYIRHTQDSCVQITRFSVRLRVLDDNLQHRAVGAVATPSRRTVQSRSFLPLTELLSGPGRVVGIATGYGLDGQGIESRWGRDFPHLSRPALGQFPASCTMGTRSFPGVKSGRGVTLTPHPLLEPWSRKSRAIPLLPLRAVRPVQSLRACTRVHLNFSFYRATAIYICSKKTNLLTFKSQSYA
jgi:hypothetical protein